MNAKVTSRQSLFDVAMQHCGSAEEAFDIALQNGLSLTDDVANGAELTLTSIVDKTMVNYLAGNLIKPATQVAVSGKGIGYWVIGRDFIVS